MSISTDLNLIELGLDALEDLEVRSLVWGLVDVAMSHEEVSEALRGVLHSDRGAELRGRGDCTIYTAADLRDRLVKHKALFPALDHHGQQLGWRTRMAEGVRLLTQVRQLFPRHRNGGWTNAATLVADYRLVRRPRRYPKRDITPTEAREGLSANLYEKALQEAVAHWLDALKPGSGLARFQLDAASRILRSLEDGSRTGTLVSAGTGSGKTLAFYLPALAWLASQRVLDSSARGVRILALYPRNELLKDQLAAVYQQCRKYDNWIGKKGRPLRIGVLYGETPNTLAPYRRTTGWERNHAGGYSVCPFFRCPDCGEELLAHDAEIEAGTNRLVCKTGAHWIDDSTLAYTRAAITAEPPDVLFTSVEMLNRHLPSVDLRHVFGVGPRAQRAPDLVLMDEVHLYAGTYGAQVAYLMRRWWTATRRKSSFVGLSATLANGEAFFASLTGLPESVVKEIRPDENDIVQEGAEYLLALRGDPVSQSALLSTTIQTLMLGTRLLDHRDQFNRDTWPFFGWRSFAFTDQLDVANRLYRNLLDAEGRYPDSGRVNPSKPTLAELRTPQEPPGRRYLRGQDWRAPKQIGHALGHGLGVSRTTSYDSGVSTASEVVVATAALEVGFDDEAVGLVLQHKAPRDMASFLQRKGRAGRTRHTRPWTVVVLSDYGRDRMAYQAYEQLFDPELPPRELPLSNRYVQRMQAVYALLDEIGECMEGGPFKGRVWATLRGPASFAEKSGWPAVPPPALRQLLGGDLPTSQSELRVLKGEAKRLAPAKTADQWAGANWLETRMEQRRILEILGSFNQSESHVQQLIRRLADRLALRPEDIWPLMWDQPRPVLLGAIPATQRRLSSNWRALEQPESDYAANHPMPDYVPANLFDDLSLPEMRLHLPQSAALDLTDEYMRVQQALSEFAPGKVSRRFTEAYWLGFDVETLQFIWDQAEEEPIHRQQEIADWYMVDVPRDVHAQIDGEVVTLRAYRPLGAFLQEAGAKQGIRVGDTSNAQVQWTTQLLRPHGGDSFAPPFNVGISTMIEAIQTHTHARQNAAVARRYAHSSRAELRLTQGKQSRRFIVHTDFVACGRPAGIGFDIETDALVLVLQLPAELHTAIIWTPDRLRAARAARYNYEAQRGEGFSAVVPNLFMRNWIAQIFQIASIIHARANGDLRAAMDELAEGAQGELLFSVLSSVFQAPESEEETSDRLRENLAVLLKSPEVLKSVRHAGRVLIDPVDSDWNDWLSLVLRTTLGAACLQGIQEACPQVDADELVVDVDPGLQSDGSPRERHELWISEVNPGGNGLIEQVVELLASKPDLLFRHIEAALGPQDLEFSTAQLRQMASWLGGDSADNAVVEAVDLVRQAKDVQSAQSHFGELRGLLIQRGQSLFHGYAVSLSMRFLRPNSPGALDRIIEEVCAAWGALEDRLGIEIDVRVLCALYSSDNRVDNAFAETGMLPPAQNREQWRVSVLANVLWSRGHALRAVALPMYNRYVEAQSTTERLLLSQWLTARETPIDPRQEGWLALVHDALRLRQVATISLPADEASAWMRQVTQAMVTDPIQFDYLNVFVRLSDVKRVDDRIEWTYSIPEPL